MRYAVFLSVLTFTAAVVGEQALRSQAPAADLLIVNAKIHTVDSSCSTAQALAISNGRFTAVGTTAPAKSVESMNVLMTMVGGKVVYQQAGFKIH